MEIDRTAHLNKGDRARPDRLLAGCPATPLSPDREELVSQLSSANEYLRRVNEELAREIAEHRDAAEALRLSEDKFGKAFHGSPDAVLITRVSDGRVLEVNEGFCKLSGYDRSEALASSALALDLWAEPGDRDRCIAALRLTGSVSSLEFGFRIRSGDIVECVYAGSLIEVEGQTHILSVVRDVSVQRRAEAAVQRSEQLLRGIVENLQDAYVRTDANGRFMMVSPSAARMYRYESIDEMLGLPTQALYADQVERQQMLNDLMLNGHVTDRIGSGLRKDGTTFAVSLNAQVFRDDKGRIAGMEGFVRDITERKLAEEELRRSREQYRALVENINDVIFVVDSTGTLTYVSPAIERVFGYPTGEVEGLPFSRFVHPDDLDELAEAFARAGSGARSGYEFRVIDKAGDVRWVGVRTSTVPTDDDLPRITGVMTDFTDRKRAEQELAHLNAELGARAAALEQANAKIAEIAATDELTGLANRRCFNESLAKEVSTARRHGGALSLVSLDLDGLKRVNDGAGHNAGDRVLVAFAMLLASVCRVEDLPSRLGGDEFSVLLPDTDMAGAQRFAERVVSEVRVCEALAGRGVTVSAGVAQWTPDDQPDDLVRRADKALYSAKRSGGNAAGSGSAGDDIAA
jgi:diguanylate cyclase (GGDEF)-like protein/PAS domain S-box-containing protein